MRLVARVLQRIPAKARRRERQGNDPVAAQIPRGFGKNANDAPCEAARRGRRRRGRVGIHKSGRLHGRPVEGFIRREMKGMFMAIISNWDKIVTALGVSAGIAGLILAVTEPKRNGSGKRNGANRRPEGILNKEGKEP